MFNTPFQHPFTIDEPTWYIARQDGNTSSLSASSELGEQVRFLEIDPAEFTHAYTLLGANPQRFTTDLTLYLSTVRAFFERTDCHRGIEVPANADADAKKRLSEDLGVALSSKLMASLFGVTWDSITQIPQNNKLSKKRPDFIGFTPTDTSFIFESKGTTVLGSIEKQLSSALGQVKKYPVQARSKIAIVSYLAADKRFFPSSTFVVDPPFPDIVVPDARSARILHGEKILQYLGLEESAGVFLDAVAAKFRLGEAESSKAFERSYDQLQSTLETEMRERELDSSDQSITRILRSSDKGPRSEVIFGVSPNTFSSIRDLKPVEGGREQFSEIGDGFVQSNFPDGTTLRISIG